MKRRKAFAKEEKLQIIIGVFITAFDAGEEWLSVADVARKIDNTPSTKLRVLLQSLIGQGALVVQEIPQPMGIRGFMRLYSLSPEYLVYAKPSISQQKKGHSIRLNTPKGQFIEVLR